MKRTRISRSLLLLAMLAAGCVAAATATGAPLLTADFNGTFPPSGWQLSNAAHGAAWLSTTASDETNQTGGTGQAAMIDAYAQPGAYDATITSPAVAIPAGATDLQLSFLTVLQTWSGAEVADVDVSADNGATWTNVKRWADTEIADGPVAIPLAAFAGKTIRVRFHYYNADPAAWDLYWQVDDVLIDTQGGAPPTPTPTPTPTQGDLAAVSPADAGSVAVGTPPTFSWQYTGGGTPKFVVELVPEVAGFTSRRGLIRVPRAGTDGGSYTLTAAEWRRLKLAVSRSGQSRFAWRVVTLDGTASAPNVVGIDAGTLTRTAPAQGAALPADTPPTFTFQYAGSDLTSFCVQVSATADFSNRRQMLTTAAGADPSITLTIGQRRRAQRWLRQTASTTLYWRVLGRAADRTFILTGDGGSFQVEAP